MLKQLLSTIILCLPLVLGYPNGAPPSACGNMVPQHGNNKPQPNDTSPYQIIQETDTYNPGDHVAVYVYSPEGTTFKGLMVQAYDPDTDGTIGKYMEGNGLHNIMQCSSMTHSDPSDKKSATLIWIAPKDRSGNVKFRTTVVKKFNKFWVRMLAKVEPLSFSADQTSVDKVDSS